MGMFYTQENGKTWMPDMLTWLLLLLKDIKRLPYCSQLENTSKHFTRKLGLALGLYFGEKLH